MDLVHRNLIQLNMVTINQQLIVDDEFLSYFVSSRVMTENNMEEILAEKTTAKKSSAFIMMIRRRGPKAFPMFIEALVNTNQEHIAQVLDPQSTAILLRQREHHTLPTPTQETLGPGLMPSTVSPGRSGGQQTSAFNSTPVNNEDNSFMTVRVHPIDTTDSRVANLLRDTQYTYPVKSAKRGRAIIINNEYFLINQETQKKLSNRDGTGFDLINLDQLLQSLYFTTVIHSNLNREEIINVLVQERNNPEHEAADAFIMCILSHGAKGYVFGTDGREVNIEDEICASFDGNMCKYLVDKPKIFIIQACQGKESTSGVPVSDAVGGPDDTSYITQGINKLSMGDTQDAAPSFLKSKRHEKSDMLIAYSTVSGYKSWRRPDLGSWFVRAIVDIFAERAHTDHVVDLLTKVRNKVAEQQTAYQAGDLYVQVTKTDSTLLRNFYFFPGYKGQS